jgi:hypothetical protein
MMDDKDEKDNHFNGERPEDETSDNDIPLWLQGLEDDELEEPKTFVSKEDVKDAWMPEIEETIDDDPIDDDPIDDDPIDDDPIDDDPIDNDQIDDDPIDNDQIDDDPIDDDKTIGTPAEPTDPGSNDLTTDDRESLESETTEEIDIDELPSLKYSDEIGPSLDDLPSSEGFMDISEIDFSESQKQEDPAIENEALIEGDLPEWLQEMISEQDKPKTSYAKAEELEEQDIIDDQGPVDDSSNFDQTPLQDEPIDETRLVVKDDFDEDDILEGKDEIATDDQDPSSIESSSKFAETAIAIAGDETTPVVISIEDDRNVQEEPITEEPIAEEPIAEEPIAEKYIAEEPIGEEPIAEEPIVEEPIAEEPIAEEPIAEEYIAEEPIAEEPIAEEPIVEEPIAEEYIAEEPIVEEPIVEEPIAEEPIAEEPIAEEPLVEEPIAEEFITEEPIAEEFITEEPIAEEPSLVVDVEPKLVSNDEQLERAKRHLDQGNFDLALPVINKLLEDDIYTQTLELWIKEATESQAKTNSEAWAILGDITLRQNKPREAFDAYAKAIKYLLTNDEVYDETR